MIWLRNKERFSEVIKYDPRTYKFVQSSASELPKKPDGFFSYLSSVFVAVFRLEGQLYLRLGEHQLPLDGGVKIEVLGSRADRVLNVEVRGESLGRYRYSIETPARTDDDLTPFVDEEDDDFGLFLANLAKNPARQAVMLAD